MAKITGPAPAPLFCQHCRRGPFYLAGRGNRMAEWPATRVTLLDRLHDPRDREAWAEFVALYGPLLFRFARHRLPQDEDAADVMQEALAAVMGGRYQRPRGRFQKWLV